MKTVDSTAPFFKSFSWLSDRTRLDHDAMFAADAMAVTHGGIAIANLVRGNSLKKDNGDAPLMGDNELDCLVGLLIYSLEALNESAEKQIDRLEQAAEKGAKK